MSTLQMRTAMARGRQGRGSSENSLAVLFLSALQVRTFMARGRQGKGSSENFLAWCIGSKIQEHSGIVFVLGGEARAGSAAQVSARRNGLGETEKNAES